MADPVSVVTHAPARAFSFVKSNVVAAALLVLGVVLVVVYLERKKPGTVSGFVRKIPLIGTKVAG